MNRSQLAHILRAACRISEDRDILVIGSQSILGTYDEEALPPEATASIEADIAFVDALIRNALLELPTLIDRARLIDDSESLRHDRAISHLRGYLRPTGA